MKKLLSILLSLLLLCACLPLGVIPVSAATSGTTGDCRWRLDGTKLTIFGNGRMENYDWSTGDAPWGTDITDVTIEEGVTFIGESSFEDCAALKSVSIPNSVTTIHDSAFSDCSALESVTIPDSVKYINSSAFSYCTALTSVAVGDGVISIGHAAFMGCSSLLSITLGKNVTSLYLTAFQDCDAMTAINVVEGNETYSSADGVLFDKNKTVLRFIPAQKSGTFVLPDSVSSIVGVAFTEATRLTAIVAGEGNESYMSVDGVLFNKDQTTLIRFPAGKSGDYIVPDGVTTIGYGACENSIYLNSIILPDSVTTIESNSFLGCTSLSDITVPDSITYIENRAFDDTAYYNTSSNWDGDVLYVDNHLVETKWSISGTYAIKEGTKTIAMDAFNSRDCLTAVYIPDSVVTIAHYAFAYCEALESVVMGNGVETIGNGAFEYTAITSINIPDSVTSIGYGAFRYCGLLTSVTIPDSVTSIDSYTFSVCSSLTSVTIPNSVTSIGYEAFGHCYSLTNVYYAGSEEDRFDITIDSSNYLLSATWHYNYIPPCEHTYDDEYDADCNKCGEVREVPERIIYGDINGDGVVSTRDLALLQQYIAGWDVTLNEVSADANGDGAINARDLALLQQYIAGWDVTLGPV